MAAADQSWSAAGSDWAYNLSQTIGRTPTSPDGVGATSDDIYQLIASQAVKLTFAGIGCGLLVAEGLRSVLARYLFGISSRDPLTIAGACCLLAVIAIVSTTGPAIRAISTDPVQVLRHE